MKERKENEDDVPFSLHSEMKICLNSLSSLCDSAISNVGALREGIDCSQNHREGGRDELTSNHRNFAGQVSHTYKSTLAEGSFLAPHPCHSVSEKRTMHTAKALSSSLDRVFVEKEFILRAKRKQLVP